MRVVVLLLLAAAAAPAAPAAAVAPAIPADAPPETRQCLRNTEIRGKTISAEAGYFARTQNGWWRNTGAACSAYAPDRALLTRANADRQCSGDVVQVFHPFSRIEYGGCTLGAWERVAGPPEVAAKH